jgi:VWFA-related protein
MSHSVAALLLPLAILGVSTLELGPVAQTQKPKRSSEARNRSVYVGVVDNKGNPVTGLTAADFSVREDGAVREVLSAGLATDPIAIALTVDDSQASTYAIQFIRDALKNFVKKMDGRARIALSTVGERPTSVVEYTESAAQLEKGVTRLFARSGAGAYLLEAIVDLSRGLERREEPRKAIIAITVESGPEFSTLYSKPVLDALYRSGATLHVLAIGQPANSMTDEGRNRNIVIADGSENTGGRRDQILAESGLNDRLLQLGDELLQQYVVSYTRPETLIPPEKIEVTVNKPGLTVHAPRRLPAK